MTHSNERSDVPEPVVIDEAYVWDRPDLTRLAELFDYSEPMATLHLNTFTEATHEGQEET